MSTGNVPALVCEHADDLIGRLRIHQRAGVDEDALAVHHEGVEGAVVDDDDADVLLEEPGCAQDRLRVVAQQLLDLGVAQDRRSAAAAALSAISADTIAITPQLLSLQRFSAYEFFANIPVIGFLVKALFEGTFSDEQLSEYLRGITRRNAL